MAKGFHIKEEIILESVYAPVARKLQSERYINPPEALKTKIRVLRLNRAL